MYYSGMYLFSVLTLTDFSITIKIGIKKYSHVAYKTTEKAVLHTKRSGIQNLVKTFRHMVMVSNSKMAHDNNHNDREPPHVPYCFTETNVSRHSSKLLSVDVVFNIQKVHTCIVTSLNILSAPR